MEWWLRDDHIYMTTLPDNGAIHIHIKGGYFYFEFAGTISKKYPCPKNMKEATQYVEDFYKNQDYKKSEGELNKWGYWKNCKNCGNSFCIGKEKVCTICGANII